MVGGPARYAVVEVLSRMRKVDEREERERNLGEDQIQAENREDEEEYSSGLFRTNERKMFRDEILQQVVIGIGRLDTSKEVGGHGTLQGGNGGSNEPCLQQHTLNEIKPRSEDVATALSNRAAPYAASESQPVTSTHVRDKYSFNTTDSSISRNEG